MPVPKLGDEELPGRETLVGLEATGFGRDGGPEGGPVDLMKSAKSRRESSFAVGPRATAPGDRGAGDLGTDLGGCFAVSSGETGEIGEIGEAGEYDEVVGLTPFVGLERKPFRPLSFDRDLELAGRSGSVLVGAELRRKSASSAVSVRKRF